MDRARHTFTKALTHKRCAVRATEGVLWDQKAAAHVQTHARHRAVHSPKHSPPRLQMGSAALVAVEPTALRFFEVLGPSTTSGAATGGT